MKKHVHGAFKAMGGRLKGAVNLVYTHMKFWGESYVLIPATIVMYYISLWFVNIITGAQVIKQPDIEGFANNAIGIAFAASATGVIQFFLFDYAATQKADSLGKHIHDSAVTIIVFTLCLIAVWRS